MTYRSLVGETRLVGVVEVGGAEAQAHHNWNNKTARLVSDVHCEARLEPNDWGTWLFKDYGAARHRWPSRLLPLAIPDH